MTTNACAKRGCYPENPSARLWKAIAFAGGLVLGLYSVPLHAAPSSGGDAAQGLYHALLGTMKSGKALGQSGRFTQSSRLFAAASTLPQWPRSSP
jgi:hypothetical protein